jgi:hypothetical protein
MNPSPERENLLNDVLGETAPADFRAALLADTLLLAGHRRRSRQLRRGLAVAAVVALGAFASWRGRLPATDTIAGCEIVRTQLLAESAVIRTQRFVGEVATGSQPSIAMIETPAERAGFRLVNDDELLALALPRTAALVRVGPDAQALIFLPQPESQEVPLN